MRYIWRRPWAREREKRHISCKGGKTIQYYFMWIFIYGFTVPPWQNNIFHRCESCSYNKCNVLYWCIVFQRVFQTDGWWATILLPNPVWVLQSSRCGLIWCLPGSRRRCWHSKPPPLPSQTATQPTGRWLHICAMKTILASRTQRFNRAVPPSPCAWQAEIRVLKWGLYSFKLTRIV